MIKINIANFEDNIAYRQFSKIYRQAINIAGSGNTAHDNKHNQTEG